jgi:site-specific DNA recombinase
MRPELVRALSAEYHRELDRLGASAERKNCPQQEDLVRTEREIRAIIDAIKGGIRTPSMQAELLALEARKEQLARTMKNSQPTLVRLRADLAELYRKKIARLDEELNTEAVRGEAAELLRGLLREIRLIPEDGELGIELVGDLAAMLNLANGNPRQAGLAGTQITMVAGERVGQRSLVAIVTC